MLSNVLTDKEYRALPFESYSSLKYLLESPQAFIRNKETPFEGNDSTRLGTAVHHLLQGKDHLVTICPIDKRKKKEYEEWFNAYTELNPEEEAIILSASFGERYDEIKKNVQENKFIKDLLEEAEFEIPAKMYYGGFEIKGKADAVIFKKNTLVEIKTSALSADVNSFREEACKRHYDLQAALYCKLYPGIDKHIFIVINTTGNYGIKLYQSSKKFMGLGYNKLYLVMNRYDKYIIKGEEFEPDIEEL